MPVPWILWQWKIPMFNRTCIDSNGCFFQCHVSFLGWVFFFRLWESRTKPTHLLRLRPGWGVDANLYTYIYIYIMHYIYIVYTVYIHDRTNTITTKNPSTFSPLETTGYTLQYKKQPNSSRY